MLVLTRKYQEKIRIGNDITITVLRTKGKAVRLGIEAPSDVPVIRGELSFEDAHTGEAETAACESAPPETATTANRRDRKTATISLWSTDSHPNNSGGTLVAPSTRIESGRVRRDKVAEILPNLMPGSAPLRAMLDRRTSV